MVPPPDNRTSPSPWDCGSIDSRMCCQILWLIAVQSVRGESVEPKNVDSISRTRRDDIPAPLPAHSGGAKGRIVMKCSIARAVVTAALLAVVLSEGRPAASQEDKPYAIRYLTSLGGTHSRGNSVNNTGWVSGYSHLNVTYRHATLWNGDTPIDLGTLGSPQRSQNSNVAWPVKNTGGVIVGISQTDAPDPHGEDWSCAAFFPFATRNGFKCLGFVWENGKMQRLPTLGGTHGFAAGVNNLRQIVGWAETDILDRDTCTAPQLFQFRAVVWGPDGKEIHALPLYPGDNSSAATAINDKGQIVGISGVCDQAVGRKTALHAVLWDGGAVQDIGNLGGKEWNTPTAINQRGDIAGFSDHEGEAILEAFIWTRERGIEGLGFLADDHTLSEAFGINERRQVVGLSCGSACRAFLWQDGVMADLNDLVPPQSGIVLTHAMDINDDGVITGRAANSNTGELQTYVATPVAGSQFVKRVDANAAIRSRHSAPIVRLPAEVMRQILSPLGPGPERLGVAVAR
jgi:probable HAF family extracellular repeat protein